MGANDLQTILHHRPRPHLSLHAHKAFVTRWPWHIDLATDATKSRGSTPMTIAERRQYAMQHTLIDFALQEADFLGQDS